MVLRALQYMTKLPTGQRRNIGIVGKVYGDVKQSIGLSRRFALSLLILHRLEHSR
jgi:hypothetical protein